MDNEGTLGHAIKNARIENDYTQQKLGEELEITHAFLSRIENNKVVPNDKMLQKIANILDFNGVKDYLNEFRLLAGAYENLEKDSKIYKNLKTSGRLEINKLEEKDSNNVKIVEKPFYKLNYLFECEKSVFYDVKFEEFGEKITTVEIPSDVLHSIYKEVNKKILDLIIDYPEILNSIDNVDVMDKYREHKNKKMLRLQNEMEQLKSSDYLFDLIREHKDDINL